MIQVSFEDTENVAENIKTFWFKTRRPVHYTPGQFTQLRLAHQNVDKRGDKRWFTLSSSPSESLLAITTKLSQPGSSFKRSLRQLQPGTELHLADPTGDFVLPKDASIPLIFVAGGIGITPMRSMIKWLTDMKEQRHITLLYAVSTPRELAFLPLLKRYCQPVIILSREVDGQGATLTAQKIITLTCPSQSSRIYLSGPEPMIEALVEQFKETAVDPNQLLTDYFPGYQAV